MQYIMTGNIEQVVIWRPIVCCQLWVRWGKKIDNHIIMIEMTTQKKNLCWTFQEKTQHVLEVSARNQRDTVVLHLFLLFIFSRCGLLEQQNHIKKFSTSFR